MNRTTYAEGDPIYSLVRLKNVGPDTVCVPPMSLDQDWLTIDLARDTTRVPGGRLLWVDAIYPPGYRGEPLPPGQSRYEAVLVTERWSDGDRLSKALFQGHLPPGVYALDAHFEPWLRYQGGMPINALPVAFIVRSRDSAENAAYEAWMGIARGFEPGHWPERAVDSLMGILAARVARDSADPLPATLAEFVVTGEMVQGRRRRYVPVTQVWQAAAARHTPESPAGAWAASRYANWWLQQDSAAVRLLADSLKGSVASEVLDQWLIRSPGTSTRCSRGAVRR